MKLSNLLKTTAVLALSACFISACGNGDASTNASASQAQTKPSLAPSLAEPKQQTAPPLLAETPTPIKQHVLKTGQSVVSLAAIPATAHLGKSHIVAAHGADGVSIRDTSGTVLTTIDTPARLVAHYQDLLVVYSQDEEGVTTLKRYKLNGPNEPTLVDTASPSPIAATTLQRTSIASLGPLQVSGTDLIIGDKTVSAPGPITAVASASYFPPLVGGQTLLIATENGDIIIQANKR